MKIGLTQIAMLKTYDHTFQRQFVKEWSIGNNKSFTFSTTTNVAEAAHIENEEWDAYFETSRQFDRMILDVSLRTHDKRFSRHFI